MKTNYSVFFFFLILTSYPEVLRPSVLLACTCSMSWAMQCNMLVRKCRKIEVCLTLEGQPQSYLSCAEFISVLHPPGSINCSSDYWRPTGKP